jgi:hypothetical protein
LWWPIKDGNGAASQRIGTEAVTRAQRAGDGAPLQIDDLVARIDRAVWNLVPGYNDATLSHGEYVRYLTSNVERLLAAVTERRSFTRDDMAPAHELGERRADQGMPFESMVRSYHLSERIMLDTLLAAHSGLGADQLRSSVSLLHENNGALAEASYLAFLGTLMTITVSPRRADTATRRAGRRADRTGRAGRAAGRHRPRCHRAARQRQPRHAAPAS